MIVTNIVLLCVICFLAGALAMHLYLQWRYRE